MGGASYDIDRGEKDRESSLGEPRQAEEGPIYSPGNSESRKAQILEPTGWVQGAEGSCVSFPTPPSSPAQDQTDLGEKVVSVTR